MLLRWWHISLLLRFIDRPQQNNSEVKWSRLTGNLWQTHWYCYCVVCSEESQAFRILFLISCTVLYKNSYNSQRAYACLRAFVMRDKNGMYSFLQSAIITLLDSPVVRRDHSKTKVKRTNSLSPLVPVEEKSGKKKTNQNPSVVAVWFPA